MLETEKPDGLIILVKPDATPGLIREAVKSRIPFLTEKPPSTTVSVHRALIDATGDLPHVIAYNRRFTPYAAAAREWLGPDALHVVQARMCRFGRLEPDFTGTAVHAIDAALFLAGGQVAEARLETVRRARAYDYFMTAWTQDDRRIELVTMPDSSFSEERYVLTSDSRSAAVTHPDQGKASGQVSLFEADEEKHTLGPADFGTADDDWPALSGILAEHHHFVDLLEGRSPSPSTLQDTLNTQRIREALRDMLGSSGRTVAEINFA